MSIDALAMIWLRRSVPIRGKLSAHESESHSLTTPRLATWHAPPRSLSLRSNTYGCVFALFQAHQRVSTISLNPTSAML
jgi:hypothetical protein